MTTVLTDNELLALYDNQDNAIANFDTGVAVGMGVEDERRGMWDAFAAYKAAQRRLNVAILRRHEGRLARALEAREVRGWLDALAKVLGLVEAKPAGRGRLLWLNRSRFTLLDNDARIHGWLTYDDLDGWAVNPIRLRTDRDQRHTTEADARTALLAALRADGWEVPEDEVKPAREEQP